MGNTFLFIVNISSQNLVFNSDKNGTWFYKNYLYLILPTIFGL